MAESDIPKNFVIRCLRCHWKKFTSGVKGDLTDLHEIKSNCPTCGKWRTFKCPKCGTNCQMRRFRGNA